MKFLKTYTLLITALVNSALWAGPSVGGGGDVIILPDDSVVLADPFIDSGAPQPNNMPPLRALNPRILQVINLYTKAGSSLISDFAAKESDINATLAKLAVRNNDLRFYGVQTAEELNQFCAPGGRKIYKLPNGAQVQQVACTAGNETFMVEPLFSRLSLRDQGLLLIHERLTTLRDQYGGKNYSAIARFTTGLNVYLNLYSEQNKKKYRMLSVEEQKILTDFFVAVEEIEKRNSEVSEDSFQWQAHRNGGGRVHVNTIVNESAFISLQTVIAKKSEIGANAKLINFYNPHRLTLMMGDGVSVINLSSVFTNEGGYAVVPTANSIITLKDYVTLEDVTIKNNTDQVVIGENSNIKKSTFDTQSLVTGESFTLTEGLVATKNGRIGRDVSVVRSHIGGQKLKLDNNVSIEDSKTSYGESFEVGASVEMRGSELISNVTTFGANAKIERLNLRLDRGSASFASDTLVTNSSIFADHFSAASGTKIETTFVSVETLVLGSYVEFREAKIDHSSLNAKVASGQKLIGQQILKSTYEAYYPLGFVPQPISYIIDVPNFKCVLPEKTHSKTAQYKKEILDANKDGVIVTGESVYQGRVSVFKDEWNYDYNNMKVKIIYKTFNKASDKSALMISSEGMFVNPDYKRESLKVDASSFPICVKSNIATALSSYYSSNYDAFYFSSGGL